MADGRRPHESFDMYETRVKQYGWSWFRADEAAKSVLQRLADVRGRVYGRAAGYQTVGTEVLYEAGERSVEGRDDLHRTVVQDALRHGGFDGTDARDAVPQAVLLLGLPGSGKSSMLRPVAHELLQRTSDGGAVVVDTDIVRTLLPEYAGGLGSEVVHPETSFVTNRLLLDEAYRLRLNIVLDKIGDPEWTVDQVEYLNRTGWSVFCLATQVDVEVAVGRAKRRAVETGRYVPPDLIRKCGERPVEAYFALRESKLPLSGAALLSTEVAAGERPVVVDTTNEHLFGPPGASVAVWPSDGDGGER